VAFFPAYPLLARMVAWTFGWKTEWALLAVSNWCLATAFVLLHRYARLSRPAAASSFSGYALAAFGLFPTTLFFRMAYSESLFLCVMLVALIGMVRRWPFWIVATVIGLATACRPVGIALLPPFALDLWRRSDTVAHFLTRTVIYSTLACWGLIGYVAYQWEAFGEPLAFVRTQAHWRTRPPIPMTEKMIRLATFEPVWGAYTPGGAAYWRNWEQRNNPLFSLIAANPAIFIGGVGLVGYGAYRHWLDSREVLLAAGLMAIPYIGKGYDNSMLSMGRFVAVVPPVYLVLANILARVPSPMAAAGLAVFSFFLAIYAAQFAVGNPVF
jgi:hypothetical protein